MNAGNDGAGLQLIPVLRQHSNIEVRVHLTKRGKSQINASQHAIFTSRDNTSRHGLSRNGRLRGDVTCAAKVFQQGGLNSIIDHDQGEFR